MNNREKKQRIFNLFSQNLEWVKEHPDVNFVPDFSDGYICPLCFDPFFAEDLLHTAKNPLTLEDVPPVSLGGKPLTLTCKSCNSKSGHELDVHLLNVLLENDSKSFLPGSNSRASFEINGRKVNGSVIIDKDGKLVLNVEPKISNPAHSKFFLDKMSPKTVSTYSPVFGFTKPLEWTSPTFTLNVNRIYNQRRADVALLRIAYLLAYANLGNGFLINGGLYKVREQILNPEKNILGNVFWIKTEFPKALEGINIISQPQELQSFLVIFNLKTKSISRQFAIVLPGPSKPSVDVYKFIEEHLCVGDGSGSFDFMVEHIPQIDHLKTKEYAYSSYIFWQRYTHPDYKPNLKPKE
ncbi:hypothetical protein SAMN05421820_11143 [Pedobacter steynii]|uniref:HNH endonuclease 5 domain-containing protein n=1 Tax=Pedobacter steynii TaxID=430522 RepID=A0A1H0G4W7_9SPHI|nr:hypothetical protein [Pedobacter steynii]NQX42323.1 hypothetical protein [Pedobacter steynii]SDO01945.1 hypothetical protein SAMN05421820_11143 [Pedobacter steynii]